MTTKTGKQTGITQVAIIGRPNVGKSSLLNMLAGRRVSIVDPTAGVTRDRVSTPVTLPPQGSGTRPQPIELIDTGGHGIDDPQGFTAHIESQITHAVAEAGLILFVIDAQTGVVSLDLQVARMLRQAGGQAPVVVVANKVDGPSHEPASHEAAQLGFGVPIAVSATSGRNKAFLIETVARRVRELVAASPTPPLRLARQQEALIAIVGKRNAGKSTLVNALAGHDRVIVSEIEGTTRDSIDVRFEMDGKAFTAIDTAGVRKAKSLSGDVEYYSHHRTLRSIRRADIALFLIDASVPVSQVDTKLAAELTEHHKPCVIVLNKWDLAQNNYTVKEYTDYLKKALLGLSFAPVVFISAQNAQGLRELVAAAMKLYEQSGHRVPTAKLNSVVQQVLAQRTPCSKNGRLAKIYYATQLDVHPPTIALFVNDPKILDATYQRYLINRFRELLPFAEVPIRLLLRGKRSMPREARLAAEKKLETTRH